MTEPYYSDESVILYHGDNREILKHLDANSLDACVTDPPYELGFMGRHWDASGVAYDKYLWAEVWRVLKPGGHLLAFGGTRTWHRLAVAIEDAGFEVRDSMAWMYGSGFPKSLDVSKAIDKAAGAEREREEPQSRKNSSPAIVQSGFGADGWAPQVKEAVTDAAKQWQGWGTALKPAFEPVVVARKPLTGTVAENVQQWGTGALNIDGCRIGTDGGTAGATSGPSDGIYGNGLNGKHPAPPVAGLGRWPANVILDESQAAELDRQSGWSVSRSGGASGTTWTVNGDGAQSRDDQRGGHDDTGGASRFFYTAKADSSERPRVDGIAHPTVKPLDLMRYLVRLVTPPGGTVLEPFAGSGTTAEACIIEGFRCVAIEMTDDYLPLIMQRITKPIEVTLL
jgi:site-specific DNA-methyltransferase (adenine-specific)